MDKQEAPSPKGAFDGFRNMTPSERMALAVDFSDKTLSLGVAGLFFVALLFVIGTPVWLCAIFAIISVCLGVTGTVLLFKRKWGIR